MAQVNLQRTQEEYSKQEYNYFLKLQIDVNETDPQKLEEAIKKKLGNASGADIGLRRMLELKSDCLETLCNDAIFENGQYTPKKGGRKIEADRARDFKKREAREIIENLCRTRKNLLKSDIVDICNTVNRPINFFDTNEFIGSITTYLDGLGVKIIDNTDSSIPFKKFEDVEKLLEGNGAGKTDLYGFLGKDKSAPVAELKQANDEIYANGQKSGDLKKKQSISKICGNVTEILLKDSKIRQVYDQYLILKKPVWSDFEQRKKYGIDIQINEYETYVQTVISLLNVSVDEAEKIIAIGCKYYTITISGKTDQTKFESCPYDECGKLYIKGAKNCPHCGRSLETPCWNCQEMVRVTKEDKGCSACGCTLQSKSFFNTKLSDIDKILRQPTCNIIDLQSGFANLKNVVPNYQKYPNSFVAQKIAEYDALVNQKLQEEETNGKNYRQDEKKVREQIALKNYQKALNDAQSLLRKYATYNLSNTNGLIDEINKVISQALSFVQQAKTYIAQNNERLVITNAAKALEICADLNEAKQILQKYPPQMPTNVSVSVSGNNLVRIQWVKNGIQDMTTYTIIKKVGSKPTSLTDGTILESNLTIDFYEDTNIVSATPYFYAVYAERCEITSPISACNQSAQIFLDVSNVRQEIVSDGITVKWDAPHNVKAIEVWKKEGAIAPAAAGDGVKIPTKGLDGFVDNASSRESSYLIICQYDANGSKVCSKGVSKTYKKYELIQALGKYTIVPQQTGGFLLDCPIPESSKVGVIYTKDRLSCRYDMIYKQIDYNSICKNCSTAQIKYDENQHMIFDLPANQVFWAYPIVSNEQLFMVSQPTLLNTIDGIQNVSFVDKNGTVLIKGDLNANAKNVIVKISTQKFPITIDDDGDKVVIPKDKFLTDGGASVKLKVDTQSYISVFTEIDQNGKQTYTRGVPISEDPIGNLKRIVVKYLLEYTPSPSKKFSVTIKFSADEAVEVPRLCIMKGRPRPISKSNGELVDKVGPISLKKGLFSKSYVGKCTLTVSPDNAYIKFQAFLDDDLKRTVLLKEVQSL